MYFINSLTLRDFLYSKVMAFFVNGLIYFWTIALSDKKKTTTIVKKMFGIKLDDFRKKNEI